MPIGFEINAKCRKCQKLVPASTLTLDPDIKLMICQDCLKNKNKVDSNPKIEAVDGKKKDRPADWDKDDEWLEKAYKAQQDERKQVVVQRLGNDMVLYKCKCGFNIKFNTLTRRPEKCGYCGREVPKFVR